MDNIKVYADNYFNKKMLSTNLPNSSLYTSFFTKQNFELIIRTIEQKYNVQLSESYQHDVLDVMITCFEYHPISLNLLNNLVLTELRPKMMNLKFERDRYQLNMCKQI